MEKRVCKNILEHKLIVPGDNVVIGLSGGPDSMALLHCLIKARENMEFNIIAVHINHGVRGEDALADQLFVERQASELNITYYTKNVNMIEYGKQMGITAEEAGRELRYGFFREILFKYGGGKIAVAHNKNDQAETLLMRIMRGTGIDGLKGMEFKVGDIIRPILNIDREDIENYIATNNIETVLDKTNLMPIYSRNKVRLELIPYIESNFNPNIINSLWRMSQISLLDSSFLENYATEKYVSIMKNMMEDKITLDAQLLLCEDRSIQQRVIRIALEKIAGSLQGFSEQHISDIVNIIYLGTGKKINLPHSIVVSTSYNDLIIEQELSVEYEDFYYQLDMGHNQFTNMCYSFNIQLLDISRVNEIKMGKYVKCFDYDKVKGNLGLRNRRLGDRFIPFGMTGSKKLKDYFIDEKINKDLRKEIPLLIDGENILWVVGYRTSDLYKLTKDTKKVLSVSVNY